MSKEDRKFYSYKMKYNCNTRTSEKGYFPTLYFDKEKGTKAYEFLMIATDEKGFLEDYITGDKLTLADNSTTKYNPESPDSKHLYTDAKEIDRVEVSKILLRMINNPELFEYYKNLINVNKKAYELEYYKNTAEIKKEQDRANLVNDFIAYFDENYRGNRK